MQSNSCIVCAGAATVYCHNDDAYLCYACDDHVHSANPLAQRHHRVPIADAAADGSMDNMIDSLVPSVFEMPMRATVQDQSVMPDGQANVTPAREASLPFDDDDFFAVPDALAVSRDQSLPFSPQTLLGKGFLSDDIDIFDIDPMLLDRLDCGYDKISCDLLDCLVPEAPAKQETRAVVKQQMEQEPVRASPKAAERPQRATAVQQQQPVLSPMTYRTAPVMSAPQHSTMTFATEGGDCTVDVSTYIPRSLLPMDPAAKMQLLAERRVRVERFREKKKNRQFKKTIRYASRKAYAEVRPRIKGRFARKDEVAAMREAGLLPALA